MGIAFTTKPFSASGNWRIRAHLTIHQMWLHKGAHFLHICFRLVYFTAGFHKAAIRFQMMHLRIQKSCQKSCFSAVFVLFAVCKAKLDFTFRHILRSSLQPVQVKNVKLRNVKAVHEVRRRADEIKVKWSRCISMMMFYVREMKQLKMLSHALRNKRVEIVSLSFVAIYGSLYFRWRNKRNRNTQGNFPGSSPGSSIPVGTTCRIRLTIKLSDVLGWVFFLLFGFLPLNCLI